MMITDPDLFLDEFATAGADAFLVHWEGNANLHRTLQRIKQLGKRAGGPSILQHQPRWWETFFLMSTRC